MSVRNFLLVGTGGFLGAVSRYYLSGLVLQATTASRFPWGTLVVNVSGCAAIGMVAGVAELQHAVSPGARLFLITGVLGGYTTFSAFAYETYFLGREHAWESAALNVALQVVLGLGAAAVAHRAVAVLVS